MHTARRGYFEVLAVVTELTALLETKLSAAAAAATTTTPNSSVNQGLVDLYTACERGIGAATAGTSSALGRRVLGPVAVVLIYIYLPILLFLSSRRRGLLFLFRGTATPLPGLGVPTYQPSCLFIKN